MIDKRVIKWWSVVVAGLERGFCGGWGKKFIKAHFLLDKKSGMSYKRHRMSNKVIKCQATVMKREFKSRSEAIFTGISQAGNQSQHTPKEGGKDVRSI